MSIFDNIKLVSNGDGGYYYVIQKTMRYYSGRYDLWVVARTGDNFDGATGAMDIDSRSWIFHDILCRDGVFEDGTICTNWQASMVMSDILASEGRWFRKVTWFAATWLMGGGKARDNGMF
jgi:hypothetical protein